MASRGPGLFSDISKKARDILTKDYNFDQKFTINSSTHTGVDKVMVVRADKGDSLKASYLQNLDQLNGGAFVGEISRRFSTNENTLTVGCSYVVDPPTVVKAKLNNDGNLGALLQHEVAPKSSLIISAPLKPRLLERTPKFGLAISLKP